MRRIADLYLKLISPQQGDGPSSTKWVYLHAGALSIYCATLATVGGVAVYVFLQKADGIYWAAVGGMWINALGFATSAKKHQTTATKEMSLAQGTTAGAGAPAKGDGE